MPTPLTVTLGGVTFPETESVEIRRDIVDAKSLGELSSGHPGIRETWRIDGTLRADSPADLEAARDALQAAQSATPAALALLRGDDTLRAIAPGDCRLAPRLESLSFDASNPADAPAACKYRAVIAATLEASGDLIQAAALTVTHSLSISGAPIITTAGTVRARQDATDEELLAAATPALAENFRRTESRITLHPDRSADFQFTDEQSLHPLPNGVTSGHYTTSLTRDRDGRAVRTVEGFFIGPAARARALELKPRAALLTDSLTENPFEARVDFRFTALVANPLTEPDRSAESVTLSETRKFIDHKPLAPNAPTYRQTAGSPDFRVIQEGSAAAANRHPSPSPPLYPDAGAERDVRYTGSALENPTTPLETRWRYDMRPLTAPSTPRG